MSRRGWKVWLTVAECRANERRLGRVNGAARRDISSGADLRPNEPWCLNDPEDRAPGTCLSTCTDKSNESRCGRTDTCTCLLMSCRPLQIRIFAVMFMKNALLAQSPGVDMSNSLMASLAIVVLTLTVGNEYEMKWHFVYPYWTDQFYEI